MQTVQRYAFILILFFLSTPAMAHDEKDSSQMIIRKTEDFTVTGDGIHANWDKTPWTEITIQEYGGGKKYATRVKVLYSVNGIYFLFHCEDEKLNATFTKDNAPLFREDVVEIFLWPDEKVPIYFEYELSPLNYELPILVPNVNGTFQGWLPWGYEGSKKIQHATQVQGGEKKSNASIKSWTAEFFIPFRLLHPIVSKPPVSGAKWRANMYRIDHDHGYTTWTWQKTTLGGDANFHEYDKYGTFLFE